MQAKQFIRHGFVFVNGRKVVYRNYKVKPNDIISLDHKFFAGAKEVMLLDQYQDNYNVDLFDRAVDFGWYYFLTKPFFLLLHFFKEIFGNYGISILLVTIIMSRLNIM